MLESCGGPFQHVYRLAQQFEASFSVLREACRTQRDAETARGSERLGEREFLGREHSGLGLLAECESREGGVGAPRSGRRTWASQPEEEVAGREEIVER